jgi:hypothetical protein
VAGGVKAQDIVAGQIMQTAAMQVLLGERTSDRHGTISRSAAPISWFARQQQTD